MGRSWALRGCLACVAVTAAAGEPWEGRPPLSADPAAIRAACAAHPPQEGKGILDFQEEYRITLDAQGRRTTRTHSLFRIDDPSAVSHWSDIACAWSPWHQKRPSLRARVLAPDGRVHDLDPATLGEFTDHDKQNGVYEGRMRMAGPLPHLQVGAIVELETILEDREPFFAAGDFAEFRLWETMPLLRSRLVLDLPAGMPLHWKLRGLPGLKPEVATRDGRTRLVVDAGPLDPPKDREPGSDPEASQAPMLSYSTCRSWAEVARGYQALVPALDLPEEAAKAMAELRALPAVRARIDGAVAYLHGKVRYTGLEFGSAAIVPRSPAETLARGYGDCKDKACLLIGLLRAAGVEARLALLDSGYGRNADPDLPGLGVFDHAIVQVPGAQPLWIDATAEYHRAGELPLGDQDRAALVIDPATAALVRTPGPSLAANHLLQAMDITMAAKGAARVRETTVYRGAEEAETRAGHARANAKDLHEQLEKYMVSTYRAKSARVVSRTQPRDLGGPMTLVLEAEGAESASTFWAEARAELPLWPMLGGLRETLGCEPPKGAKEPPARTEDLLWRFPNLVEWRYRVVPPAGFVAQHLPEDDVLAFGPATLQRRHVQERDGSVTVTFRLESGPLRWTPAQVNDARKAIEAFGQTSRKDLQFEHHGEALLEAGKTSEALAAMRAAVAAQPGAAGPRVHYASALLKAGLAEAARENLRQAAVLAPKDADVQDYLAWTLQFDLMGRRFAKGWDRAGSLAAYRRCLELDPSLHGSRVDYALALERNDEGERFGPGCDLEAAIRQYQVRRTEGHKDLDLNLLEDLVRAGRFKEAADLGPDLEASAERNGWLAAALVKVRGVAAAVQELRKLAGAGWTWKGGVSQAVRALANLRAYPEARALIQAGPQDPEGAMERQAMLDVLMHTERVETLPEQPGDPRAALVRLFKVLEGERGGRKAIEPLLAPGFLALLGEGEGWDGLLTTLETPGRTFTDKGLDRRPALDMALGQAQMQVDGDAARGYRVRASFPPKSESKPYVQTWFCRPGPNGIQLVACTLNTDSVAHEALRRVDAGDLAGARQHLDWIREELPLDDADDPLEARPFPRVWTRGRTAGEVEIRAAIAVLLAPDLSQARLVDLEHGIAACQDPGAQLYLRLCLAKAHLRARRWDALGPVAAQLVEACPDSAVAQSLHLDQVAGTGKVDEYVQATADFLAKHPASFKARWHRNQALQLARDLEARTAFFRALVQAGSADPRDYNNFAWHQLTHGACTEETLALVRRAVLLSRGQEAIPLHTLAAILAESGHAEEALTSLRQGMALDDSVDPDGNDWYVLGRIAEALQEPGAARRCYARVQPAADPAEEAESSHALALRRLQALDAPGPERGH